MDRRDLRWSVTRLGVACGLITLACVEPPFEPVAPRLVVVYATCSLNKDFLSPYRSAIPFTPALEAFASRAVVFDRHQTESGQSGTAFASLFAGVQADEHGVYHHPTQLRSDLYLLTEAFADAGYSVHAFLAHAMAAHGLGYAQGARGHGGRALEADLEDFQAILAELRAHPEQRALIVTNFTVTHGPYPALELDRLCEEHPERCRIRNESWFPRLRGLYEKHAIGLTFDFAATVKELGLRDEEIERLTRVVALLYEASVVSLDVRFGRLLAAIDASGLAEESLVVFTADHGEILYREDAAFHWSHGFQLAPEVLNVPLMIRAPGLGGARYEAVTRSVDVFPTVAGLSGISLGDAKPRGTDLARALHGRRDPPEQRAWSHTALFPPAFWDRYGTLPAIREMYPSRDPEWMRVGVRDHDEFYELQHRPGGRVEHAVFDLARDPTKRMNLFDADDPEHVAAAEQLGAYRARLLEGYEQRQRSRVPRRRQIEALRELGYIE